MALDKDDIALKCIGLVLRPGLKLCLRHSVRMKKIIDLCKTILVDIAAEEIQKSGKPATISRINVMTGVHRAEVARIYTRKESASVRVSIVEKVINRWQQDKRFQTEGGRPRVLALEGMDSDFVELLTSVSTDLNPYTVLFEMERVKAVTRTSRGIKLSSPVYYSKDLEEAFRFLSEDASDLLIGVSENIDLNPEFPNLHIKTFYDNIPAKYEFQIRRWFLEEGETFHKKARKFLSKFDRDANPKQSKLPGRIRVAVGSFSVTTDLESD